MVEEENGPSKVELFGIKMEQTLHNLIWKKTGYPADQTILNPKKYFVIVWKGVYFFKTSE